MEIPLSSAVNAAKTTLWQSNEAIYLKLDVYEVDNIANFVYVGKTGNGY